MSVTSRKVKFVASDPDRGGLPVKRKQVQHACPSCRRKKRRCSHAPGAVTDALEDASQQDNSQSPLSADETSPKTPTSRKQSYPSNDHVPPPLPAYGNNNKSPALSARSTDTAQPSRFVGDLNPEGMFIEAADPPSAQTTSQKADIGLWISSGPGISVQGSQFITARPPQIMDRFLLPFVKEHCLCCLPPEEDFLKLKAVFLKKVHPLFPIVPLEALTGSLEDPCNVVLRQCVCLAASADSDALPHLRLQNRSRDLLTQSEFSQTVSSAVRAILETSIIADRVLHIRALSILALYTQPTCAEEEDLPAQLGSRAIHHVQTLGLHLLRYDAPNVDDLENLFCATWALDRINSTIYARAYLFHERDLGADLEACIKKRPPCFRLLLNVLHWLDQVVELYRPGAVVEASGLKKVAYIDLPVLEGMIVEAQALNVPSHLIATIETLYHAVIILSCRLPRPGTGIAASTLPPSSANARRSLAAERIACAVPRDCLTSINFVPYAVSLALSVEYRKMRHSRLPMFRARAMNAFRRNCDILRKYADYFWSAKVIAGLGERVLKEMERAATTLNKESSPPTLDEVTPRTAALNQGFQSNQLAINNLLAADLNATGMGNMVDFSLIDPVSGQDIFGHIDPSFNLDAVETALEANLDVGYPVNWGDWGQYIA